MDRKNGVPETRPESWKSTLTVLVTGANQIALFSEEVEEKGKKCIADMPDISMEYSL